MQMIAIATTFKNVITLSKPIILFSKTFDQFHQHILFPRFRFTIHLAPIGRDIQCHERNKRWNVLPFNKLLIYKFLIIQDRKYISMMFQKKFRDFRKVYLFPGIVVFIDERLIPLPFIIHHA